MPSWIAWALLLLCAVQVHCHEEKSFLFSSRSTVLVPGVVHVGAVGFAGDGGFQYELERDYYQHYLSSLYKFIVPTLSGDDSGWMKYVLKYRVDTMSEALRSLEDFISKSIRAQIEQQSDSLAATGIIEIPVTDEVEKFFDNMYTTSYATSANEAVNRYAALALNPSFARIKQSLVESSPAAEKEKLEQLAGYRWRYNGVPTNSWVAAEEYAVIDVAADPVYRGPSDSPFGVRSPLSIPFLADYMEEEESVVPLGSLAGRRKTKTGKRNILFEAALGCTLNSLSSHVFFPDLNFPLDDGHWNQIYIPIMVFKNHADPVELNQLSLHRNIRKAFPRSVKLDVKFGTHSLHDHKHLSIAVSKSLRTRLSLEMTESGLFETVGTQYLDSKALAVELRRASDALASVLLDQKATGARNRKVLPVYVLSLHDLDETLLFEDGNLVSVEDDMVLVLQTNSQQVPVPMIVGMEDVTVNATNPHPHIMAGIVMNQGVLPPHEKESSIHERKEWDFAWALGAHPFGPWARSEELSPMTVALLRRTNAVANLYLGVQLVREIMTEVDLFAEKYLHRAVDESASVTSWIDAAYHGKQAETNPLLYTETVDRLHDEVISLADRANEVTRALLRRENEKAIDPALSFLFSAEVLRTYATEELRAAAVRLTCCRIHYKPRSSIVYYGTMALGLSFVAVALPLFVVLFYGFYRAFSAQSRVKSANILPSHSK